MVEKDSITGIDPIGLPIVHRDPVGIELGDGVGAPRIKRRRFPLRNLLYQAIQLRSGSLVDLCLFFQAKDPDGFQQAQGPDAVGIGSILGVSKLTFTWLMAARL